MTARVLLTIISVSLGFCTISFANTPDSVQSTTENRASVHGKDDMARQARRFEVVMKHIADKDLSHGTIGEKKREEISRTLESMKRFCKRVKTQIADDELIYLVDYTLACISWIERDMDRMDGKSTKRNPGEDYALSLSEAMGYIAYRLEGKNISERYSLFKKRIETRFQYPKRFDDDTSVHSSL